MKHSTPPKVQNYRENYTYPNTTTIVSDISNNWGWGREESWLSPSIYQAAGRDDNFNRANYNVLFIE